MADALPVIGIGHITCDVVCPLHGWPEVDTKTIIPEISLTGGGPSANAMAALARLGVGCGILGRLGDDVLGKYTLAAHEQDGIDVSHVIVDPAAVSPVSIILTDLSHATRTILLTKGERTTLDPAELDWNWLKQVRVIHLDGHQIPASLAVARQAKSWPGTRVVLDAGSVREGMLELCALADIVIASQRFVRELTHSEDYRDWLQALIQLGAPQAGVTMGEQGSVFRKGTDTYIQAAYPVNVVDTTGAGDSYHGGFIYGMLQGMDTVECLRTASAVAALKCRGLGARAALPTRQELANFLEHSLSRGND